jgi:micrococcal nuclease
LFSCFRVFVLFRIDLQRMLATPKLCPSAVLSLALAVAPIACASSQQQEEGCVVLRVADGDTFTCRDGRKVRLIGIDSPEPEQRPFGSRARQELIRILPLGSGVRLEHDVTLTDQYGRRLAYVWLGPTLVNEAMVHGGWAVLYTVPPNVKYAERFRRAQNEARTRGAGLWAQNGFACLPKDFRKRACLSPP